MAVFTPVSLQDLTPWISSFSLGSVSNIRGISSGIENSNFFVSTEKGEYVLTLFEKLTFDELPFYLRMNCVFRKNLLLRIFTGSFTGALSMLICSEIMSCSTVPG